MSCDYSDMSLQDWNEHINNRLDVIYKELCDFELTIDAQSEAGESEDVKFMELLETVNDIYRTAQNIRPVTATLQQKKDDLQEQMELLQRSVDLLKLEQQPRSDATDDIAMQE